MKDTDTNQGSVYILEYLIILAKHGRMIIFVSAAMTVLVYWVFFILPNEYTATARLLPPQQNLTLSGQILDSLGGSKGSALGGGGGFGGMGGMAASLLGLKSPGEIFVSIMYSNTVEDRIIERFNLMKVYKTKYFEEARKRLGKEAKISVGKKDGLITIEVTSINPKLSAEIANAFIKELERLLQELANIEAKGRLAFLEKERQQTSQNLSKSEEALRSFSERNSVLQIDTQTRGALEYIARLRAEIDSKEVSIQVLRQQATPFNYDMVRLETEIKGLKEKLRTAECQYDSNNSDVCLPTSKTPGLAMEYIRFYRETKFQESLYQLYNKLVQIARMDMARDIAVIQTVDVAQPPEKKSNRRLFPAFLAGMVTFFIMVLVAFVLEYIQGMKNRENEIQRLSVLKDYLRPWRNIFKK
ncbi:MAG: Wzz/FepE/Etk N-terminal domain-containing protein [Thermodesulfobacteriota bacterium]